MVSLVVGHSRFIDHIALAEFLSQRLVNSVEVAGKTIGIPLPCIRPASIQSPHGIGVWTCHKDLAAIFKRKDIPFVLKKHLGFDSGGVGRVLELLAAGLVVTADIPGRIVEQAETEFKAENPADSIIYPGHRNQT